MLKKTITYENFDGNTVTDDFYFNMTKAELVELELSEKDGLAKTLQDIVDSKDGAKIIDYFKRIILMSYGERSDDGRKFLKSPDIANSFSHTEAYSQLFMELSTDADSASKFINAIMPSDLVAEVAAMSKSAPEVHALPVEPEVLVGPGNPVVSEPTAPAKAVEEMTRAELEAALKSLPDA